MRRLVSLDLWCLRQTELGTMRGGEGGCDGRMWGMEMYAELSVVVDLSLGSQYRCFVKVVANKSSCENANSMHSALFACP